MSDDKYGEGFTDVTDMNEEELRDFLDRKTEEARNRDDEDDE